MACRTGNGKINQADTLPITIGGVTKTAREWARGRGVSARAIAERARRGVHETLLLSRRRASPTFLEPAWPGANSTPYSEDRYAQALVQDMGGMTLTQVGVCLGLSRERVRQIEEIALRKVRLAIEAEGVDE